MNTQPQITADLYPYLNNKFGRSLTDLITPPTAVHSGERVVYQLIDDRTSQRPDIARANQEIKEDLDALSAMLSEEMDGVQAQTDPIVDSRLPYPRAIDIPYVADLALGGLADAYATSDERLPAADFPVRWLLGVVFGYSAKYLLYVDFTHPKVGAIFTAEYDVEMEPLAGRDIPQQLEAFIGRRHELVARVEANPDVQWGRIVQTERVLRTATMKDDKLIIDEVSRNGRRD